MDLIEFIGQLYLLRRVSDFCRFNWFINSSFWWDFQNTFAPFVVCLGRFSEVFLSDKQSRKSLHLIHIGKCAGSSVRKRVLSSERISRYSKVIVTHVARPIYSSRDDHLLVLRGPISRSISAFNWRYYLVVETGKQSNRFRGEKNILLKYRTLNNLAEALYCRDGSLNKEACNEYHSIHHLRESISYYLNSKFFDLNPLMLIGVICQNDLQSNCADILGICDIPRINNYSEKLATSADMPLSPAAKSNLKKFLRDDYSAIAKLYALGHLSHDNFSFLMNN